MIDEGSGSRANGLTSTTRPPSTTGSKTPQWELFREIFCFTALLPTILTSNYFQSIRVNLGSAMTSPVLLHDHPVETPRSLAQALRRRRRPGHGPRYSRGAQHQAG